MYLPHYLEPRRPEKKPALATSSTLGQIEESKQERQFRPQSSLRSSSVHNGRPQSMISQYSSAPAPAVPYLSSYRLGLRRSSSSHSVRQTSSSQSLKSLTIATSKKMGFGHAFRGDRSHRGKSTEDSSRKHRQLSPVQKTQSQPAHPPSSRLENESEATPKNCFRGLQCAGCDMPMEMALRDERPIALKCGHVWHEACLAAHLEEVDDECACGVLMVVDETKSKDVAAIEQLLEKVRLGRKEVLQASQSPPTDVNSNQPPSDEIQYAQNDTKAPSSASNREFYIAQGCNAVRRGSSNYVKADIMSPARTEFSRSHRESTMTGRTGYSSDYYTEGSRKCMSDAISVDAEPPHRGNAAFRPIPHPLVTVRSEFPTISQSGQQQPFTCLVTVEVPANGWTLDERDLQPLLPPKNFPTVEEEQELKPVNNNLPPVPPLTNDPRNVLNNIADDLTDRVINWHNLDWRKFGELRHWGIIGVSKDRKVWQVLECYLFEQMLICVRERNNETSSHPRKPAKCKLKGSILMRKHLQALESFPDEPVLHLRLSAPDVPSFYLLFNNHNDMHIWKDEMVELVHPEIIEPPTDQFMEPLIDEYKEAEMQQGFTSHYPRSRSSGAGATEMRSLPSANYTQPSPHVPLDIVVVASMYQSMHGIKLTVLKDTLRFMLNNLGPQDRLSIVTFGSPSGPTIHTELRKSDWSDWDERINSLKPAAEKNVRGDMVEGTNMAVDLLMMRTFRNPLSSIMLISDSNLSEPEDVDYVISRAEAAKAGVYSFGYGMTHKPETMIELSTRTRASYTFVKDWMVLRECVAGCLGGLQTISHQNVKVKLHLPEGSPAKFFKISGALQATKRVSGKDAEASLGDLKFGDKRDILVQLSVLNEATENEAHKHLRTSLEALGGAALLNTDHQYSNLEEIPLLQADVTYGDILREGHSARVPRPSLLTVTMLPKDETSGGSHDSVNTNIPPHPAIIQRRMELLTSDMLSRSLTLAGRGQVENAQTLLIQTRAILSGLGKAAFPPRHLSINSLSTHSAKNLDVRSSTATADSSVSAGSDGQSVASSAQHHNDASSSFGMTVSVDSVVLRALDADLAVALEWMAHPVVFNRDSRKATLQAIGAISSQRAFTFRTLSERLFAEPIDGVRRLIELSESWRANGDVLHEE